MPAGVLAPSQTMDLTFIVKVNPGTKGAQITNQAYLADGATGGG